MNTGKLVIWTVLKYADYNNAGIEVHSRDFNINYLYAKS